MNRKIIVTEDNSKTLLIPELNETYHSTKGAIQEARHVFIQEGLAFKDLNKISVLEMGFGTGLNALLSLDYAIKNNIKVHYVGLEAFPISLELALEMDYPNELKLEHLSNEFHLLHNCPTNQPIQIHEHFSFTKLHDSLEQSNLTDDFFDLIYYDAFGPKVQPELWNIQSLTTIYKSMLLSGHLVTYCAQGQFKRNLKELGMTIESIPGPPGKREMTRAKKN